MKRIKQELRKEDGRRRRCYEDVMKDKDLRPKVRGDALLV